MEGLNGRIQIGNYPDISTGRPVTNFQPFFPSKDFVGSQIKAVTYGAIALPYAVPYLDFIQKPLAVGRDLDTSV